MKFIRLALLTFALLFMLSTETRAQRFAYVDTEYILNQMPEYSAAQKQLDLLSNNWAKEIDNLQKEIEGLYRAMNAEQVLLTDEMRQQRETDIKKKEASLSELQKKRFGFEGDLFAKKKELIKPIQDKVFETIQKLAKEKGYDFIFDKNGEFMMLYANPKMDKSDEVIEMMGIAKKAKDPNKK